MLADPHAWNAGSEVLAVRRTGTSWMGTLKRSNVLSSPVGRR